MSAHFLPGCRLPARSPLLALALALLATGCTTQLNDLRAQRFGNAAPPLAAAVAPQAVALALRATPDGLGLMPESLQAANTMLTRQGRIDAQVLTLTPFNARGEQMAPRLAQALARNGAPEPRIAALPTDAQRLAEAAAGGWDLELQSEALAPNIARCSVARPNEWTIHPFHGIGALGCANRANIARMASDPRDLVRPRTLDGADGKAAAGAVHRYQNGNPRDLLDIDFDN